jgi:hypothetical protein
MLCLTLLTCWWRPGAGLRGLCMHADELYLLRVEGDLIATLRRGKDVEQEEQEVADLRLVEAETLCQEIVTSPKAIATHSAAHPVSLFIHQCILPPHDDDDDDDDDDDVCIPRLQFIRLCDVSGFSFSF